MFGRIIALVAVGDFEKFVGPAGGLVVGAVGSRQRAEGRIFHGKGCFILGFERVGFRFLVAGFRKAVVSGQGTGVS